MKDITSQVPDAICEQTPGNVNRHLIINRDKPPFNNPELRRAMALSLDRKAFIDIVAGARRDRWRLAAAARRAMGHAARPAERITGL
jgi:peptide/nickel transport system substrate-binding protein